MSMEGSDIMPISREEMKLGIEALVLTDDNADVLKNDVDIIEYMLDNCEIEIPRENRFFVRVGCEGCESVAQRKRAERFSSLAAEAGLSDGIEAHAYSGTYDFGHTSAEWTAVISLGIYGLRERIAEYERACEDEKKDFYGHLLRVYDAALRFIARAAEKAFSLGKNEMGEGLLRLCADSPRTLFEALQTSVIYYTLQQFFDGTPLRTLGRLDGLLYPYYVKHVNEERTVPDGMLRDYMREMDSFCATANIPFAICGTDENASDLTNELSYVLLNIYSNEELFHTKLHILCSEETPNELIENAFRCIRGGNNSIVFMSDKRVIEALELSGAEH